MISVTADENRRNRSFLPQMSSFHCQYFQTMTKRMVETDRDAEQANNWKFAAIVIDRLCLYLFTVFLIASTCGTLLSAPNSSDADNYNITAQGAFPIK